MVSMTVGSAMLQRPNAAGGFDHAAGRRFSLIPDDRDAVFHRLAPVAAQQLGIAERPHLAGGDLRPEVAEARVGIADIVAQNLPQRLIALPRLIDLQRAQL